LFFHDTKPTILSAIFFFLVDLEFFIVFVLRSVCVVAWWGKLQSNIHCPNYQDEFEFETTNKSSNIINNQTRRRVLKKHKISRGEVIWAGLAVNNVGCH